MTKRVVVTGLGVVAPNGNGAHEFEAALRSGTSGIRAQPKLAELGFGSRVAGVPQGVDALRQDGFEVAGHEESARSARCRSRDPGRIPECPV